MLQLQTLTKTYPGDVHALRNVSLDIHEREFFVLFGPAGAGKSTTLRLISGIAQPSSGEILRDGHEITRVAPEHRDMSMCFESYALYSHLSVFDNLAFPLKARKLPAGEIRAKVQAMAENLSIGHLLDRKPHQLSGGQKQRVALGRTIIRPARTYLLDEPIGHLDARLRNRMRAQLKVMAEEINSTMILTTTSSREALALGDRVAILNHGRVEQIGTPAEIYARPRTTFVGGFVGEPPLSFIPVHPEGAGADLALVTPGGRLTGLDPTVAVALRPAAEGDLQIGLRAAALRCTAPDDAPNTLRGRLSHVERLGLLTVAYVQAGHTLVAVNVPADLALKTGEPVGIAVDPRNLHLFRGKLAIWHPADAGQTSDNSRK